MIYMKNAHKHALEVQFKKTTRLRLGLGLGFTNDVQFNNSVEAGASRKRGSNTKCDH